jgi:Nitrile hydratase, alpha chain
MMGPQGSEHARKYGRLFADVWADDSFRQRLLADPKMVLAERGRAVPEGVEIRVVENTDRIAHLVLPPSPTEGELSEEQFDQVAGGPLLTISGTGAFTALVACQAPVDRA